MKSQVIKSICYFFSIIIALITLNSFPCYADKLDIHSLHSLSNTMQHDEFLRLAIRHDSLTRSITTEQWYDEIGLISDDTLSMRLMPTLYDLIANDYYSSKLPQYDSVAQAWYDFHKTDPSSLPRLYITLHQNRKLGTDSLLSLYASLPDTWERGYILSDMTACHNAQLYLAASDHLQRFGASPFAPNIRYIKECCKQIEVAYFYSSSLHSYDSVTITYHNTNAHEIIFELYRVPDKFPKKGNAGSYLVKVDSVRVTASQPLIFKQTAMTCKMAPLPYGQYCIRARLPEDTLQLPVDSLNAYKIQYRTFFVSDLQVFALFERPIGNVYPRIVVTDTRTGQPVKNVKVRHKGSLSRHTNKNGEALFHRHRGYEPYSLIYGADKYHWFVLFGRDNYTSNNVLSLLPNATVFRPGDTLKLTIIGNRYTPHKASLLKNKSISVCIRGAKLCLDTVVTLDNYGATTLSFPFTEDMRRGGYNIVAYMRNRAAGFCYVMLEDYRLPSFSLAFDDSCRTMNCTKLTPITGKAIRTNGMPVVGATVTADVITSYPDNWRHRLNKVTTDRNGTFRFTFSDDFSPTLCECRSMRVEARVTSSDGETHMAMMQIALTNNSPADCVKREYIAGVPKDSLLWLPNDSIVRGDSQVMLRLGVPETAWVYCAASDRSHLISHSWRQLTPGMHTYTFSLPRKTDDYLDVLFMRMDSCGSLVKCERRFPGINQTELHITPVSMRDYLTPGAQEMWTFRLTDAKGKPAKARMVLSMTDKALESLNIPLYRSTKWTSNQLPRWRNFYTTASIPCYDERRLHIKSHIPSETCKTHFYPPMLYAPYRVDTGLLMVISGIVVNVQGEPVIGASIIEEDTKHGTVTDYDGRFHMVVRQNARIQCSYIGMKSMVCNASGNMYVVLQENKDTLNKVVVTGYGNTNGSSPIKIRGIGSIRTSEDLDLSEEEEELEVFCVVESSTSISGSNATPVPLRQGDTRLALYLPELQTDSCGEVHVRFTTPPDNTEWIVQGMAWTKDAASDYICRTVMARRTLMVRLQLPRFMRYNDAIQLPCIISNTTDSVRDVTFDIQIRDAETDSLLVTRVEHLSIAASSSHTIFLPYKAEIHGNVVVRAEVRDRSGASDGEQRLLQVLPVAEHVNESVPFYLHGTDTTLTLCCHAPAEADNRKVTLMLCNNPVAYVVAGLPQGIDSSAVTVTQVAHNLYALAMRNHLSKDYPALITPVDITSLVNKLKQYQRGTGFSWLKSNSSSSSYYLTLQVLTLLGELQQVGALDKYLENEIDRAVRYIDQQSVRMETEYRKAHHDSLPDYSCFAQYAYVRALYEKPKDDAASRIFNAALDSLYAQLNPYELTTWPFFALTFERAGQHERALAIVNGLRRYATLDKEHGMYWNNLPDRWWWYRQADIQATFLLAFTKIDPQSHEMDAMKQWLILNNRTTDWGKSSLNAYVTYALTQSMTNAGLPKDTALLQYIALSDTTSCYTLKRSANKPVWGALTASYNAPVQEIRPFVSEAIRIERTFERTDTTVIHDKPLSKGDYIRVTLTLTTDREMDNVIITDHRSALLEPLGMSEYGWINGTLYYQEVRNSDEIFYVEHIRRGTTVLSYNCYATASGTTLAGLATATCELAPEFTSHTAAHPIESE